MVMVVIMAGNTPTRFYTSIWHQGIYKHHEDQTVPLDTIMMKMRFVEIVFMIHRAKLTPFIHF